MNEDFLRGAQYLYRCCFVLSGGFTATRYAAWRKRCGMPVRKKEASLEAALLADFEERSLLGGVLDGSKHSSQNGPK